ncbi:MAG: hypothetical protein GYA61_01510 [Spirochaetales bacterium]|nr:hypothetical protein [Spirochaetales bacterium]
MRKLSYLILFFLLFLLIFLSTKMILAQETFEGSFLSLGLSYAPSLISGHNILADLSYLHYFGGWFGLGVGVDALYNLVYEDLYVNAFIRLAIRRFYFEGGITHNLIPSNHESMIEFENIFYPYISIRFDLIMSETEKGAFNINILIGMIFTTFPTIIVEDDNFLSAFIASMVANGVGIVLNSFKIGIGFTYTFYMG